jgi:hypothetical protein
MEKNCPHCYKLIDERATICPYCQSEILSERNQEILDKGNAIGSSLMKNFWWIILVVFLFFLFIAFAQG